MREPTVDGTAEQLLDVVEDLCALGSMLLVSGRQDRAEVLIEQAADLLAHRADVLARARTTDEHGRRVLDGGAPVATGMPRWTN